MSHLRLAAAGVSALALTLSGFALGIPLSTVAHHEPTGRDCLNAVGAGPAAGARQRAFAAASKTYGVPAAVLLGVSYLRSRWDDHGAAPSTSGGYGPMHLTEVAVEQAGLARGDGSVRPSARPESLHTVSLAARLTKLDALSLRSEDAANICGGAAVLASYQGDLSHATGADSPTADWYDAVKAYSGAAASADAAGFADQVFTAIKRGEVRTTNDGQKVQVAPHPTLKVPAAPQVPVVPAAPQVPVVPAAPKVPFVPAAPKVPFVPAAPKSPVVAEADAESHIDCPKTLACEWVPAPYEQFGATPSIYGNHDLADREHDLDIDYIVIHDTEVSYATTLRLVQDPADVSWNYSIRSSDGHVAQHLDAKDVGFQAGNWYVNTHSIGIEHEGSAAQGATWYTEAMYQSSAKLVRHLADRYSVKLDRAHIIGHDQVPGMLPANVPGMHSDPGPYWDWEHFMSLLGAPLTPDHRGRSSVVTVKPGFDGNQQLVTGCSSSDPCPPQGTNFVYLHTEPDPASPLVKDAGLHPDGSSSTTKVSDHGARLAAGQQVVVAQKSGDWLGVSYLGDIGWLYSPKTHPVVIRSRGRTVSAKPGVLSVPVYGRAYPEQSAYTGTAVPYQPVTPLQYTIKAGQKYVLADGKIDTSFYYAKTFDSSLPDDHTVVNGQDRYYEIWFGHRMFFVRAADVVLDN
jgi:N-acetyl-anhydromuramyl-L-alanine amidase AmpD